MKHTFESPNNTLEENHNKSGSVAWQSPSNIALIKYWGKKPIQTPQNASISFTLSDARSETKVVYRSRKDQSNWIQFKFEGFSEDSFAKRIAAYFESLIPYFPFIKQLSFTIESRNTFPHSSGIASSASAMSALAMCLCDIEHQFWPNEKESIDLQKASFIARLGSGSASRSIYPIMAAWGHSEYINGSDNLYAIPYSELHEVYYSFHDDVLIVSAEKKSVSSSAGHQLMDGNPFAASRYKQAEENMRRLVELMKTDKLMEWGSIVESEAMTLHALMMCSDPSYILMKPETLTVIDAIRQFRKDSGLPIFFTLDAGPNIHILYPHYISSLVQDWIEGLIKNLPENSYLIKDQVGNGPSPIVCE
ncbi:MAG: diphosphomevalonate decarboxylase [Saprospiraceae bacterium]